MSFRIPDYQINVLNDLDSLRAKSEALDAAISRSEFGQPDERRLMRDQLELMGDYAKILVKRVNSWPHPYHER